MFVLFKSKENLIPVQAIRNRLALQNTLSVTVTVEISSKGKHYKFMKKSCHRCHEDLNH